MEATLASRVQRRRRDLGLTQAEPARRIARRFPDAKVSDRYVRGVESGTYTNLQLRTLAYFAAGLETTPARLVATEAEAERLELGELAAELRMTPKVFRRWLAKRGPRSVPGAEWADRGISVAGPEPDAEGYAADALAPPKRCREG